eukprot:SAG31_NODE_5205_length_2677_cov_4.130334_4_plen_151_part_00
MEVGLRCADLDQKLQKPITVSTSRMPIIVFCNTSSYRSHYKLVRNEYGWFRDATKFVWSIKWRKSLGALETSAEAGCNCTKAMNSWVACTSHGKVAWNRGSASMLKWGCSRCNEDMVLEMSDRVDECGKRELRNGDCQKFGQTRGNIVRI